MNLPINLPIVVEALNPDIPLKKHTGTVHIEANFTAMDHKLLNILYKGAYDRQNWDENYYYVKLSDVKEFLGRNQQSRINRSEIEKSLNKLLGTKILWNIYGQDQKNEEEWDGLTRGGTTFISSWDTDYQCIKFSLSPQIKNLIKHPNIFMSLDIRIQKKLTSKYEIILYELLIEELDRTQNNEVVTRWYTIGDLLRIFGAAPDSYLNEFKVFNKYCIKDPIATINELGDILIEIDDATKVRNKIVAYRFKVTRKNTVKDPQTEMDFHENATEETYLNNNMEYDVFDELSQIFNNEDTARKIFNSAKNKYTNFDFRKIIAANIEYAKRNKNRAVNFCGYVRDSIEFDYAGCEKKLKEAKQKELRAEQERKLAELQSEQKMVEDEQIWQQQNKELEDARKKLSEKLRSVGLIELPEHITRIADKIGGAAAETWILVCQLFIDSEKNVYMIGPSDFFTNYLEEHYNEIIKTSFSENNIEITSLNFVTEAQILTKFFKK